MTEFGDVAAFSSPLCGTTHFSTEPNWARSRLLLAESAQFCQALAMGLER